jgi:hypothetical protein
MGNAGWQQLFCRAIRKFKLGVQVEYVCPSHRASVRSEKHRPGPKGTNCWPRPPDRDGRRQRMTYAAYKFEQTRWSGSGQHEAIENQASLFILVILVTNFQKKLP